MKPEDRAYYDTLMSMFISSGWKNFIEGIERDHRYSRADIDSIDTLEQLHNFHGRNYVYKAILNFEKTIRAQLDELEAEEEMTAEVVPFEDII